MFIGFNFENTSRSAGRMERVSIRGKARRMANLGGRVRLKLGYSHKIFVFLFSVLSISKNKYEMLALTSSRTPRRQIVGVQIENVYNRNGFWSRVGALISKKGKRV